MSRIFIVAGAGFGDEGKGKVVDFLTRKEKVHTVVRFNGGGQAAHNVVLSNGKHHTFSQFGSGFFAGARTHLSRYMLVNPSSMINEAAHLVDLGYRECFSGVTVDKDALITTPFHIIVNQVREKLRGVSARHGSCGMGIGETIAYANEHPDALRASDLTNQSRLSEKLLVLLNWARGFTGQVSSDLVEEEIRYLSDYQGFKLLTSKYLDFGRVVQIVNGDFLSGVLNSDEGVVFEGAQGVLLDEEWGFHPYTTRSNCTFGNAQELIREQGYQGSVTRLAVLRAYHTRHGLGPLVTEDSLGHPELHNGTGTWQGHFRQGHFDTLLARYAREALGGVDGVALTHLDRVKEPAQVCIGYQLNSTKEVLRRIKKVSRASYEESLRNSGPYDHPFGNGVGHTPVTPVYSTNLPHLTTVVSTIMRAPVILKSYGPKAGDTEYADSN